MKYQEIETATNDILDVAFEDNSVAPWAEESVRYVVGSGILENKENGGFAPQSALTEKEVEGVFSQLDSF
ncbi:MAG: S-layer homology domain-containing protein [Bacillota bacterium]